MTRLTLEPEDDLDEEALFDDPPVVVASRDHPRVRGRNVRLAQLMDEAWCLPHEGPAISSHLQQVFQAAGLGPPKIYVTCLSMQTQTALV